MIVVRLLVVAIALWSAMMVAMWMFTGQRRFLRMAWQAAKIAIIAVAVFFGLMLIERVLPL